MNLLILLSVMVTELLPLQYYQINQKDLILTRSGKVISYEEKLQTVLKVWGAPTRRYREMNEDFNVEMEVLQYGADRLYFYNGAVLDEFRIVSPNIIVTNRHYKVGGRNTKGLQEVQHGFFWADVLDNEGYDMALIFDIQTNAAGNIRQIAVYPTH